MKNISEKRKKIMSGNTLKGITKSDKNMKYNCIRYFSDFSVDDVETATKAMEIAGAFDVPGVGSWKIEPINNKVCYLFFPGTATKTALMKQEYMWMQIGRKTTKIWNEKFPDKNFSYIMDTAKEPNGIVARFRKHKRMQYMLKEFYKDKEKVKEALGKAKELAEQAAKI